MNNAPMTWPLAILADIRNVGLKAVTSSTPFRAANGKGWPIFSAFMTVFGRATTTSGFPMTTYACVATTLSASSLSAGRSGLSLLNRRFYLRATTAGLSHFNVGGVDGAERISSK